MTTKTTSVSYKHLITRLKLVYDQPTLFTATGIVCAGDDRFDENPYKYKPRHTLENIMDFNGQLTNYCICGHRIYYNCEIVSPNGISLFIGNCCIRHFDLNGYQINKTTIGRLKRQAKKEQEKAKAKEEEVKQKEEAEAKKNKLLLMYDSWKRVKVINSIEYDRLIDILNNTYHLPRFYIIKELLNTHLTPSSSKFLTDIQDKHSLTEKQQKWYNNLSKGYQIMDNAEFKNLINQRVKNRNERIKQKLNNKY